MESCDTFLFCQRELIWNYLSAFQSMKQNGDLCDIIFKAGSVSISAHRVVLAAGIPYFRQVFATRDVENKLDEIAVAQINPEALELLIDFVYTGKIEISTKNVESLLSASLFLQLGEIQQACCEFLSDRLSVENVWKVRKLAEKFDCRSLAEQADCCMRERFVEFSNTEDFLDMQFSSLKGLISSDDLRVDSEEEVFEAAMKWVKALGSERHRVLPELLKGVRMTRLSPVYLFEKVANDEIIRTSPPCRDLLEEVKFYLLLPEKRYLFHNFPTKLRNHERKIYAVCASKSAGCCVKFYNSKNEKWSLLATTDGYDYVVDVVVSDEKLYLFGGVMLGSFHLKTHKWSTRESIHEHACGAGVVLHSNNIYIFGNSSHHLSRKVLCFDISRNRWQKEGSMIIHRSRPGVVSMGESIFVLGGYPDGMSWNTAVHKSVERYDPQRGKSNSLPPMLVGRYWFGVSALKDKVYVCGGCDENRCSFCSAEVFDPVSSQWNFISSMNTARHSVSLVSYNEKLYAIAGKTTDGLTVSVEVYDPGTNSWTSGVPIGVPDEDATSVRAQTS